MQWAQDDSDIHALLWPTYNCIAPCTQYGTARQWLYINNASIYSLLSTPTTVLSRHTVRVGKECGDRLRHGPGTHELEEVDRGTFVVVQVLPSHLAQFSLDALVDDKVDDRLRDAVVGRSDALVEAGDALLAVHRPDAVGSRQAAGAPENNESLVKPTSLQ